MSLNDIFASINAKVAAVNGIVGDLTGPNMKYINNYFNAAAIHFEEIEVTMEYQYNWIDREQTIVLYYLLLSYNKLIDAYGDTIRETRWAVEKAFSDYYDSITYKMESAIQKTYNEIDKSVAVVDNRVTQVKANLEAQIEAEVGESESWLKSVIDNVEHLLGIDVQSLWDGIAEKASEIYGAIEAKAASIYLTIDGWVKEIWDYVVPWFEWIEAEFIVYYNAVRKWIADKATEIYAVIEAKVKELKDFIELSVGDVWRQLIKVQLSLKTMIANLEATLRSWVTKGMKEIEGVLTTLSMLTDWRFQFLNIFMSKPELSILQVLNRDEQLFQQYKPYWQALFTRVLEPE